MKITLTEDEMQDLLDSLDKRIARLLGDRDKDALRTRLEALQERLDRIYEAIQ